MINVNFVDLEASRVCNQLEQHKRGHGNQAVAGRVIELLQPLHARHCMRDVCVRFFQQFPAKSQEHHVQHFRPVYLLRVVVEQLLLFVRQPFVQLAHVARHGYDARFVQLD